jgi:hypothetical protein
MADPSLINNPWFALGSSLLSGAIAVVVSLFYQRRWEKRRLKLDCLRRLLGARYVLTQGQHTDTAKDTLFIAINEVVAIYSDAPAVISALKALHADLADPNKFLDNIVILFRAMADDLGIDRAKLTDSFFLKPFKPNG